MHDKCRQYTNGDLIVPFMTSLIKNNTNCGNGSPNINKVYNLKLELEF